MGSFQSKNKYDVATGESTIKNNKRNDRKYLSQASHKDAYKFNTQSDSAVNGVGEDWKRFIEDKHEPVTIKGVVQLAEDGSSQNKTTDFHAKVEAAAKLEQLEDANNETEPIQQTMRSYKDVEIQDLENTENSVNYNESEPKPLHEETTVSEVPNEIKVEDVRDEELTPNFKIITHTEHMHTFITNDDGSTEVSVIKEYSTYDSIATSEPTNANHEERNNQNEDLDVTLSQPLSNHTPAVASAPPNAIEGDITSFGQHNDSITDVPLQNTNQLFISEEKRSALQDFHEAQHEEEAITVLNDVIQEAALSHEEAPSVKGAEHLRKRVVVGDPPTEDEINGVKGEAHDPTKNANEIPKQNEDIIEQSSTTHHSVKETPHGEDSGGHEGKKTPKLYRVALHKFQRDYNELTEKGGKINLNEEEAVETLSQTSTKATSNEEIDLNAHNEAGTKVLSHTKNDVSASLEETAQHQDVEIDKNPQNLVVLNLVSVPDMEKNEPNGDEVEVKEKLSKSHLNQVDTVVLSVSESAKNEHEPNTDGPEADTHGKTNQNSHLVLSGTTSKNDDEDEISLLSEVKLPGHKISSTNEHDTKEEKSVSHIYLESVINDDVHYTLDKLQVMEEQIQSNRARILSIKEID